MAENVKQRELSLNETNRRMKAEIVDRQRTQEALQRFMDVLEMTPDLVAMADREGRVLYINNGGRRMLGLSGDDQLEGVQFTEFLPQELRSQFLEDVVHNAENDGVWENETLLQPRQGNAIPISQVILAHKSNSSDIDYYSTIARDISEQKQAEQALTAHRDELEQRVTERTQDLQQEVMIRQQTELQLRISQEKAESANRAKSEFLANISHELRTPLNGILGYAQILSKQKDFSQDKQREGLAVISQCGEHLLTLINDILDLAKVESGSLELQSRDFALPTLLAELNGLFQTRFQEKRLNFQIHTLDGLPTIVQGDDRKLRQVLINLLGNAVKFTEAGAVTLCISLAGDRIRFEVEDSGSGMPEDFLAEIFRPFSQLGDPRVSAKGTGLGLAISYQLVELMGGKLQVESVLGEGSRFWFDIALPEGQGTVEQQADHDIIGFDGRARRILIVDDKLVNRAVLIGLLEPLGFVCEVAVNGQDCLDKMTDFQPDLVLLDLVMPGIDGLEVTRRLRQLPHFSQLVIVALSASAYDVHKTQCLEAGCDEFLAKPVQAELLLDSLQNLLGLHWRYQIDDHGSTGEIATAAVKEVTLSHLPEETAIALWQGRIPIFWVN